MPSRRLKNVLTTAAVSFALVSAPAFAMRVTNLDKVAHYVEVTGAGAPERRLIQPNDTEYFTGQRSGMISLVSADVVDGKKPKPKKHDSVVHADGLLSGIIGNERDSMPADPDNDYTIWEGGHLNVQSRLKHGGSMF